MEEYKEIMLLKKDQIESGYSGAIKRMPLKLNYLLPLLFSFCHAQKTYNDLQGAGYKGNVKTITIYSYSEDSASVADRLRLTGKVVFYYNRVGNVDSSSQYLKWRANGKLEKLYDTYISFQRGKRLEVTHNYLCDETDTTKQILINDSIYKTSSTKKCSKQMIITECNIDGEGKLKRIKMSVFEKGTCPVLTQTTEYYGKRSDGFYSGCIVTITDKLDKNEKTIFHSTYADFDKHRNPGKIIYTGTSKGEPPKQTMEIYEYQYY
ncbi:hypothetical protein A8C56_21015 [Niabella ginsenosidivorans]|uniref:Uncharacterized protein n=1 Tax=Niabella ginsenosidivorans TaxID=1176587 RepID=A0A1A9I8U0_9BACT|nr:hypothetical protein [Niabella ginsenosidivorans]ANH83130.1 hypothetical protein A8C56_21015 [Niabella ginsenosidivorans]